MSVTEMMLLVGAGGLGGVASAMVGGASLFTFPALIYCGVVPVMANASNSVALTPGSFLAAWSDRRALPAWTPVVLTLMVASFLGGGAGALLLVLTPADVFVVAIPLLIAMASVLFHQADRIRLAVSAMHSRPAGQTPLLLSAGAVFVVSVYGGYFGAGLGILLLAALSATVGGEFREINALKNLLGGLTSSIAVVLFAAQGLVAWHPTLLVMAGASAGSLIGAQLLRFIRPSAMRTGIVGFGAGLTLWYAYRYWFAN